MRSKNCVQSHRYAIIYVAEYSQLTNEIATARKDLVAAYKELDGVKIECDAIDGAISQKASGLRFLSDKITRELKDDAADQAIFTGALKLASGLLHVIPVGQPYLGGDRRWVAR